MEKHEIMNAGPLRWWLAPTSVLAVAEAVLCAALASAQDEKARAPERIPEGKTCLDCHKRLLERRVVHDPASQDCESCHEHSGDRHTFRYPQEGNRLCTECHENIPADVHQAKKGVKCGDCHDPHATAQPNLLRGRPLQICGGCHDSVRAARKKHTHGPFGAGLCNGCHNPHGSPNESLLLKTGPALCLDCHEQLAPPKSMKPTWHKPAEEGCVSCHSPHESDLPRVLLKPPPALCLECHDETAQKFAKFAVRHQALDRDRSCAGCHTPHASTLSRLLVAESADLCMKCHDRSYPRKEERPLPDLAAELKEFPQHHGPVRENNCEGCHDAHGAANFRLLIKAYPARFYAPFKEESYDLCFSCHTRDLVRMERSTATNFRDGNLNMHFLHVNREKGRTCRACHAVHASKEPHHLRATTPFGKWELPVGYEKRPDGGSCATGCHVERAYKRSGP